MSVRRLLLIVASTGLGCAPSRLPPTAASPELVYSVFRALGTDSLWPGFHPAQVALAVYDGRETWLFGHPAPPPEFTPPEAGFSQARYPGRHRVITTNTSVLLNGVPTATIFVEVEVDDRPVTWAGIAVHEAFHVFQQQRHPTWRPNEIDLFNYPRNDPGALTTRRLETDALRRALVSEDDREAVCSIQRALEYRGKRFGLIDSASAAYERESERLEGLADYVELRATGAGLSLPVVGFLPEDVRSRSYATGAALALLLDRVDPGWAGRIEHGDDRYLDQILASAVNGVECGVTIAAIDEDSVHSAAVMAIDSLRSRLRELRSLFDNQTGWTLTIMADRNVLLPAQFDPLNIDLLDRNTVLHRRFIRLANDGNSIELFDTPGLTRSVDQHPLFAGIVELRVTGLASRPRLAERDGTLLVHGAGIEGTFSGAEVTWGSKSVRIRIR